MVTQSDPQHWAEIGNSYLDLLKKCLTRHTGEEVFLAPPLTLPYSTEQLRVGKFAHQDADTMVGRPRLDNLQRCVETVLADGVPGDLMETGVWRGGCCILMRAVLRVWGDQDRIVWLADSFAGLPAPDTARYPQDAIYGTDAAKRYIAELAYPLAIGIDEVRSRFTRYGLLDDQVRFLAGYFAETLPTAPVGDLAVLRLDGDMYQSTMEALTFLYGKLSAGGFCVIDDYYALDSCRSAVTDFRASHGVTDPIERIDWSGVFWRKG
ncbi:MAG TPA: TylF/MycF/NovP-related O-methyltransferase [Actinophytocola sp.]|uniref:TylF/MycF/NovP-related O-methyltransferase n=1 Tax=Actinophytocola sp. TaxID=1872138 RepID=UPI002DB7F297|nr:TylF/MycF/NovP-related O-methyltransferase [Actinophytocola sp.]HEU5469265.1 TylF/MycF/NovP-related O-methyltransferase [Actinophytocola sp.]